MHGIACAEERLSPAQHPSNMRNPEQGIVRKWLHGDKHLSPLPMCVSWVVGGGAETDRQTETEHQDQVKINLCSLPTLKSTQPLTTFFFLLFSPHDFVPFFLSPTLTFVSTPKEKGAPSPNGLHKSLCPREPLQRLCTELWVST